MAESSTEVKVAVFDGKGDFGMWKKRMMAHLSILGLKDALLGTTSTKSKLTIKKDETPEAFEERVQHENQKKEEKAEKAMSMLILNLADSVLRKVEESQTAPEIWDALEKLYNTKTLPNRIHLQHKFYTFKMSESKTIDQNVDDFLKLVSDLACVKVKVVDEVQAILLLSSLPSNYDSLKETLKYGRDTLSIEDVVNAAKSKEIELRERGLLNSQKSGEAYVARGRSEGRKSDSKNGRGRSRSSSGSRLTCWYCKKEGHRKVDCYVRKKNLGIEEDAVAAVVIAVGTSSVEGTGSDALAVSKNWHQERWIIDSGCSYHMTSRRDWFDKFEELNSGNVSLGDDNIVEVKGIGSINIKSMEALSRL